ncbi:MAG: ABC transporter substrate-binding protein [Candidatus Dactylopiibacterium sp.]|nr:ABC transporter substrate-binding protein [Candidatus Dactylopiibacterium sp.]
MNRITLAALALALGTGSAGAQSYHDAPELEALVKGGKLPAVAQRLPAQPEVVTPLTRPGQYGGTLRTALRGNADYHAILRLVGNQGLTRWSMDFNSVKPNVAESWTANADATEYTFKLRRGMRWSDGAPFTADDVLFSMNDMVANKQFFGNAPASFVMRDKLAEVTRVDDYTVRFRFASSYVGFPEALAAPLGQYPVLWQKKYCSQFHPRYNPKLDALMGEMKVKDWPSLMRMKCGDIEVVTRWGNPEKPTLDPWVIERPYAGNSSQVLMRRNPYFWQVDTRGQQLPYIDRLQLQVISEVETIVLATINGQLDFQHRHIFSIQNRPLLAENAKKGKYAVMSLKSINANSVGYYLNHSTRNEALRPFIRNKDFRIALSLATDRKEINEIVYMGQGQPWQVAPIKESKWFNEKFGTQYINHDPKQANEILDRLGLTRRDSAGYRLLPDGKRLSVDTIVSIQLAPQISALEIMRKQWQKVGVDLVIRAAERSLTFDRANANDYDACVDAAPGGMDATQNPRPFLTVHPESRQSVQWVKWYLSDGKQGEEPSPSMKKRLDLYEKWREARSTEEADRLFREIIAIAADEFEILGIVRPPRDNAIRRTNLTNVDENMPAGWIWPTPGPALPQQWFYAR